MDRIPTKLNSLHFLRSAGLRVGSVIDVGVQKRTQELIKIFPDRKHFLFEPVRENYSAIEDNYSNIEYELIRAAASNRDGTGTLRVRSSNPSSGYFTSTILDDETNHPTTRAAYYEDREISEITLDTSITRKCAAKPYLLKLDVDGDEPKILDGASSILQHTSCIIIEASARNLAERAHLISSLGFVLWDIVDLNYYRGNLSHMDIIFLARWEMRPGLLNPWTAYPYDPREMKSYLHRPG